MTNIEKFFKNLIKNIKDYFRTKKLRTPLTLQEIINKLNLTDIEIEERIILPKTLQKTLHEKDELFGFCKLEKGELISLDYDNYSLKDEFIQYLLTTDNNENPYLCVWSKGCFYSINEKGEQIIIED